jgi:hypothetical protein
MAITHEDEKRIYDGLIRVAELTGNGESPNQAIIKVASDTKIPAGHVRLMVNAYNTGRTNRQRVDSENLFDKLATFELADPKVILEAIYPPKIEKASEAQDIRISEEYDQAPTWAAVKMAEDFRSGVELDAPVQQSAATLDPAQTCKLADHYLQNLRLERRQWGDACQKEWDKCASLVHDLHDYFLGTTALPREAVEKNAIAIHGRPAELLFEKLAAMESCCSSTKPVMIKKTKKKTEAEKTVLLKRSEFHRVDRSQAPYSLIDQFIAAAIQYGDTFNKAAAFEKEAVALEFRLEHALQGDRAKPMPPDSSLSIMRRIKGEKRAFMGAALTGAGIGLGADASRSIFSKIAPKSDEKLKADADEDLGDPSHEAKLRAIRAQASLHSILNGPHFEGEDPQMVTGLFNNLTRLSPRMADQPMLLEAAMRRLASQGAADPHDMDQLLGIETKIKMRDKAPQEHAGTEE